MNETKLLNLAFELGRLSNKLEAHSSSIPDENKPYDMDYRVARTILENEISAKVEEIRQWVRDYEATGVIPLNTYHDVKTGEIVAWKKEGPEDQLLKIRQAFEVFTDAMLGQSDSIYFDKKVQRDAFEALENAIKP